MHFRILMHVFAPFCGLAAVSPGKAFQNTVALYIATTIIFCKKINRPASLSCIPGDSWKEDQDLLPVLCLPHDPLSLLDVDGRLFAGEIFDSLDHACVRQLSARALHFHDIPDSQGVIGRKILI